MFNVSFFLFVLDTGKQVLWQTVKTHLRFSIRQRFISVCTVCLDKTNLQASDTSDVFCSLLLTFSNSLYPDQTRYLRV